MAERAPLVDDRNDVAIERQVQEVMKHLTLKQYFTSGQEGQSLRNLAEDGFGRALTGVFARFAELIIQRLNQAPHKNFLAYLDLLGQSQLPPKPARVPLTFSLVAGSVVDGEVLAGTQVAAPAAGELGAAIFETEEDLTVVAAQLTSLFVHDPAQDTYADLTSLISAQSAAEGTASSGAPLFQGDRPVDHILYLAHDHLLSFPNLTTLTLRFDTGSQPDAVAVDQTENNWEVVWERWNDEISAWSAARDSRSNFVKNKSVVFSNIAALPLHTVNALESRWLRCRLQTPITPGNDLRTGMVRAKQLPKITKVTITAVTAPMPFETAFVNQLQLDLSKDFYPFGEQPKFGDTFYLAHQAFSASKSTVTLTVKVTNRTSAGLLEAKRPADLELQWEYWDGGQWTPVTGDGAVAEGTNALTQNGNIKFTFKTPPVETTVNGVLGYWIRVRISAGDYGKEASYELVKEPISLFRLPTERVLPDLEGESAHTAPQSFLNLFKSVGGIELSTSALIVRMVDHWLLVDGGKLYELRKIGEQDEQIDVLLISQGYQLVPSSVSPPSIQTITVSVTSDAQPPQAIFTYNDFAFAAPKKNNDVYEEFVPFEPMADAKSTPGSIPSFRPLLYLGFTLPVDQIRFPNRALSLYCRLADAIYAEKIGAIWPGRSVQVGAAKEASATQEAGVTHRFEIPNPSAETASSTVKVYGMKTTWTVEPSEVQLEEESAITFIEVTVKAPAGAAAGEQDYGYLRLSQASAAPLATTPLSVPSATFVTFAGDSAVDDAQLRLEWEYSQGVETGEGSTDNRPKWSGVHIDDDTENFTRSGLLKFLAPADFAPAPRFGELRYWLRVRWESGDYERLPWAGGLMEMTPRLQRMLLNTTMAVQTETIRSEILGSSDGSAGQRYRTSRTPVLNGQQLEVLEPEIPPDNERIQLQDEEGADAIPSLLAGNGAAALLPLRDVWVRWHEMSDFYTSGPRDRHYVLDHLTGEVRFGDGISGLIPPIGTGNLRMARYQTGGGLAGNRAANSIVQLKTTVPYVDRVTNPEPAGGGAEAESLDSLIERAPRSIRHRGRAVTRDDYEDLAKLASPEVARALCVPLSNLQVENSNKEPGTVSVIIVPRSSQPNPMPSLELIRTVRDYIKANSWPNVNVVVVGATYIALKVTAELVLTSLKGSSQVERMVEQQLARFLHPLTGGFDQRGWEFGRRPHASDLYALLEATPGVDYVRRLELDPKEDSLPADDRFLIYSAGNHQITLSYRAS